MLLGEAAHLLRAIGFAADHAILIGGMVPGLLVLDPGSATRWRRNAGLRPAVEFFCPAGTDRPAGELFRPVAKANPVAKHVMGSRLSALALSAGNAISSDVVPVTRDVELPDAGGTIHWTFRVTGLIGFLGLNAT